MRKGSLINLGIKKIKMNSQNNSDNRIMETENNSKKESLITCVQT